MRYLCLKLSQQPQQYQEPFLVLKKLKIILEDQSKIGQYKKPIRSNPDERKKMPNTSNFEDNFNPKNPKPPIRKNPDEIFPENYYYFRYC